MTPARCVVASLLGLTLAGGCSGTRAGGSTAATLPHISVTHPVLIVPGLLGSRLEDQRNGRVVWGKIFSLRALTVHETLVQPDYDGKDGLELPIDSSDLRANRDNLAVSGIMGRFTIIPHVAEVQAYAKMLEAFEVCGYRPGELASCGLDVNAAIFAYDWRRDIVENAQLLAARIRDIQANSGDPEAQVDIVAHSMGGLIAEYYVLYGGEDVLDCEPLPPPTYAGAASIRKLVLLGAPHLGSVEALETLNRGARVGWRSISNEAIFTMPSFYQLLPPAGAARVNTHGDVESDFDLYAAEDWERFDVSVFSPAARRAFLRRCKVFFPTDWQRQSDELYARFREFLEVVLRRAARLHEVLSHFAEQPPGPEVTLIGSATRSTAAFAQLVPDGRSWRLDVATGAGGRPGDGTVTAASTTWRCGEDPEPAEVAHAGAGFRVEWVDARHSRLPGDDAVLRRLAEILAE